MEDLIANEGCIISITHGGFIKRTAVSAFRAQRRGGKGVIGMQRAKAPPRRRKAISSSIFSPPRRTIT
jgi:DNA gyrase/topoisomerase IV subunit A